MTVYGLWNGGASYSEGEIPNDLEEFRSMMEAVRAFEDRYNSNGSYMLDTYYVNRENKPVYFPTVSEDSTMKIYLYDPRESDDGNPNPDRIISFGPRMGVRVKAVR